MIQAGFKRGRYDFLDTDRTLTRPLTALAGAITARPWMVDALCLYVDPDLWFPDKGGSTREAKQVCRGCPVIAECLAYALERDERHGVWGGLSERERRRLKSKAA